MSEDHIRKDEMNNLLSPSSRTWQTSPVREKWQEEKKGEERTSCCRKFLEAEFKDFTSLAFWQACVAEFIGVFFLCFFTIAIGLFIKGSPEPNLLQTSIGVCFFITSIVSALATVSGAHVNPAVTLGFTVLRKNTVSRAVAYIVFQCAGAVVGSLVLKTLLHEDRVGTLGVIQPHSTTTEGQAVMFECIITFFLTFVIMAALDPDRIDIGGSIPLLVGVTVATNSLVAGPVSGGCMNPARALGPAIAMGNYTAQWIYWLGPNLGGVAGALIYDRLFSVAATPRRLCDCSSDAERQTAKERNVFNAENGI